MYFFKVVSVQQVQQQWQHQQVNSVQQDMCLSREVYGGLYDRNVSDRVK